MCCANDRKQSTRLMQSEIAKKAGIYCLRESTSPSNILALIRQISDFASECRWSRLARSSVVKEVQFPFVCRCQKSKRPTINLILVENKKTSHLYCKIRKNSWSLCNKMKSSAWVMGNLPNNVFRWILFATNTMTPEYFGNIGLSDLWTIFSNQCKNL